MGQPTVRQVLTQVKVQNEGAAVDIYERAAIGALGIFAALIFLIFVDGADRYFAVAAFLIFPVSPAIIGIGMDYVDARNALAGPGKGQTV